jgi:hypothetical protein
MPARHLSPVPGLGWAGLSLLAACGTAPEKDSGTSDSDAAAPGGPSSGVSEDGRFELTYAPSPDPIPLSEDFVLSWTVSSAEPLDGLNLIADAWMPAHGHGMNTTPTTTGSGASWQTEGMLFHMPGDWELVVELSGVGDSTSLILPFHCCED